MIDHGDFYDRGSRQKKTRKPYLRKVKSEKWGSLHLTAYEVLVDGQIIGMVAKNKVRHWEALVADSLLGAHLLGTYYTRTAAVNAVVFYLHPGGLS